MDIVLAFTYIFDDEDWVGKIVMVVVWTLVSAIPLLGLIGVAALAGYVVELVRNMQRGDAHPLPRWDNLGDKIMDGANVVIAAFVYNLGNFLVLCVAVLVPAFGITDSLGLGTGSGLMLIISCCVGLFMLIYNLIIWPLLAVGVVHYSQSHEISAFFQFSRIFDTLGNNSGLTIQWILFSFLVSLGIGIIGAIPCLGWIATLALSVPAQGHLLGQFAVQAGDKPKRNEVRR